MRKLKRLAAQALPSMLAGGFLALGQRLSEEEASDRLGLLLWGALYGLAVIGLVRLFRVTSFGYLVAGFICGPVPAALLIQEPIAGTADDRGAFWLVLGLFGLFIGVLEWARVRAAERGTPPA